MVKELKGDKQTTWNGICLWDILGPESVDKNCGVRLILLLYVLHWEGTKRPEHGRKEIKHRHFIESLEFLDQCSQDARLYQAVSFKVF